MKMVFHEKSSLQLRHTLLWFNCCTSVYSRKPLCINPISSHGMLKQMPTQDSRLNEINISSALSRTFLSDAVIFLNCKSMEVRKPKTTSAVQLVPLSWFVLRHLLFDTHPHCIYTTSTNAETKYFSVLLWNKRNKIFLSIIMKVILTLQTTVKYLKTL